MRRPVKVKQILNFLTFFLHIGKSENLLHCVQRIMISMWVVAFAREGVESDGLSMEPFREAFLLATFDPQYALAE